jgi:hypothetical protein
MNASNFVSIGLAATGMLASWGVWVSVTIFKLNQEIALIKQEIELLKEVKEVLDDIRAEMRHRRTHE